MTVNHLILGMGQNFILEPCFFKSYFRPLKPSKAENSQKVESSTEEPSDSEGSTKVMTLEIHDNRWKVGTEH